MAGRGGMWLCLVCLTTSIEGRSETSSKSSEVRHPKRFSKNNYTVQNNYSDDSFPLSMDVFISAVSIA